MSRPERSSLNTPLRFELATEEDRPLFVSYLLATALAAAWLVLVYAVPRPTPPAPIDYPPPIITFAPLPLPPAELPAMREVGDAGRGVRTPANVKDVFSGTAALVDAGKILRGIAVAPTGATAAEPGGLKVGLETGIGSQTPGRTTTTGLSPTGSGLGTVRGGGVSRNVVAIAPPEVRAVAGGPTGISSEVGQTARAHVPQLERCYHQEGLSRNPALAGLVRLAMTVEAGRVTSAHIADRTWAGTGAAETESCLVRIARGWRLGASDAQIVLPLSFTSARR
ncbi:MAG TPA: hypothetical protein VJ650_12485 [Gemmatimonadaceae bacterium]|nr:hypothetical protein [Gemmatimonadaceae bacterium]